MNHKPMKMLTALLLVCALLVSHLPIVSVFAVDGDQTAQTEPDGAAEASLSETQATAESAETASTQPETQPETQEAETEPTVAPERSAEETGAEAASAQPGLQEEAGQYALDQTVVVDGVTIRLTAADGVFPEGARLEVKRAGVLMERMADVVVRQEREADRTVASSYTFDIKVLDQEGNELQPADENLVRVSFSLAEVENQNLDVCVYHIKGDTAETMAAESLPVETEGDTATVETDGFSWFTVEFTYGEKQYVLEGNGVMKLSELLDFLEITGEVQGVSVSAPELFRVILGKEDAPRYLTVYENGTWKRTPANDPKGTVRWVVSYEPFATEEWMDVTMTDDVTYHIVVTDAIHNQGSTDEPIAGLSQGKNPTFPANIPVADIWIDESIVNSTPESRNRASFIPGELMQEFLADGVTPNPNYHPGFFAFDALAADYKSEVEVGKIAISGHAHYEGNHYVEFDTSKEPLDRFRATGEKSGGQDVVQSYNEFQGVIGTYKWENAAVGPNGELLDVYVQYSNPIITIETDAGATTPGVYDRDAYLSLFGGNMAAVGGGFHDGDTLDKRFGLQLTIRPYVCDKSGNLVPGNFYYPMTDVDVTRNGGFGKLYGSNDNYPNYDATYNCWSETVILSQGLVQNSNGDKVYIPGAPGDKAYWTKIQEENGEYVFSGAGDSLEKHANNNFYSGFMTLVSNGSFSVTWRGSEGLNNRHGMNSNILCGTEGEQWNYRLRHSTQTLPSAKNPYPAGDDGGDIATTREGNHNGMLDDSQAIPPSVIATANGQTVVYTFYPKPGYGIRELWLWDDSHYTFNADNPAPLDKQNVYEWADGTNRYRWVSTFGQLSDSTRRSKTWVYDGWKYTWDGAKWNRSLTFSDASLRDQQGKVWTGTEAGITYTYKFEDGEWRRYADPAGSEYEPVPPPANATVSETDVEPPAEATSTEPGVGEWHLFKYFNQVSQAEQENKTWTEGIYTYEYSGGTWQRSVHFESIPTASRTGYVWYETVSGGGSTTRYQYRYESGDWHKYDVTDPYNPVDKGLAEPPANAIAYEPGIAPPDGAVSDYGEHAVPDTATNVFPSTETMRHGAGYRIYEGDGTNGTYQAHDDDGDGDIDRYTVAFENIDNNHAIHVVWGQTILEIRKFVIGNDVVPDTFTFRIKAWDDANNDYVDFSTAGLYNPALDSKFTPVNGETGVYEFQMSSVTPLPEGTVPLGYAIPIPPELIPTGFKWKVWEVKEDGKYGTHDNWEALGSPERSGQFQTEADSSQANFVNRREKEIDPKQKLTVVKVWENDNEDLRPDNITITIVKPGAIGISTVSFISKMNDLFGTKANRQAAMTGIIYGSAEAMAGVPAGELKTISAETGKGSGNVYMWRNGNDVYFYSDSQIYLTGSAEAMFSGCSNLTQISGLEFVHTDFVTSLKQTFEGCKSLTDLYPLENWNTRNVTDMEKTFSAGNTISKDPKTQMTLDDLNPLKNWDTQNVTTMKWMFRGGGYNLSDVKPLENWNVSSVTSFSNMFFRTNVAGTAKELKGWDVRSGTDFNQMFNRSQNNAGNTDQDAPPTSLLPAWTRQGKWNNGGTFNPTEDPKAPDPTETNDEVTFWNNNGDVVKTETYHKVDPDHDNIWIYEFDVDADGSTWNVYETLPRNTSRYYSVSATEPIADSNALFQKWIYKNAVYATKAEAEAVAMQGVAPGPGDGEWTFNGTVYASKEKAQEAAKAAVLPYIVATKWFYKGTPYDTYDEAQAVAHGEIDTTSNPGKYTFDGVAYDTLDEAKAQADAALTQVFVDGKGVKTNPVTGAKAATTTTIKNVRDEFQLKVHKDTTAVGLENARQVAKGEYMAQLAAAETDPTRKAALEAGDESVLTTAEKTTLQERQDAACTFTFTLRLWYETESKPYNIRAGRLPLGVTKVSDGVYTFSMIPDPHATETFFLPAGVSYRVEEANSAGWHLTSSRNTHGVLNQNPREAFFLNTRTDVVNVVKEWEDDDFADAVMSTRPTGKTSINIVLTTLDFGTRWKLKGSAIDVFSGDDEFSDVKSAFEGSQLTPDLRNSDGITAPVTANPKYVNLTASIGTKIAAGHYVIDKKSDSYYVVYPVENIPFEKTYTSEDADNFLEDDGADTWLYQFNIPATEKVIDVKESSLPGYYQKLETSTDASGRVVYKIVNTLDKRDLKIEKHTEDNEEGVFDFVVKFYVELDTAHRHPFKIGHTQIIALPDPNDPSKTIYEYEFVFENGITLNGKNVAGIHIKHEGSFVSLPSSNKEQDQLTEAECNQILETLKGIHVEEADSEFGRHHRTNLELSDFSLNWNGVTNDSIYVEQNQAEAQAMLSNGRRMDWFIIHTPQPGETISVKKPYALTDAQKPIGLTGTGGTYHFTLRNGQSIIFKDLPVGVSYEVVESRHVGWNLVSVTNDTGILTDGATEIWTYGSGEHTNYDAAKTAVYGHITDHSDGSYGVGAITFPSQEAAQQAAMDAVEVSGDGSEFYLNVDGTKNTFNTLTLAQDAAKALVSGSGNAYKVNANLRYPDRLSAQRASEKAITKKAYAPRTAAFRNKKEKGDLEIIKQTAQNEPGIFTFRVKIWNQEDVYSFKAILPHGVTEEELKELLAVVAKLPLEASHAVHQGVMDYVTAQSIGTDKTASLIHSSPTGIRFSLEGAEYMIGSKGYVSTTIPEDFEQEVIAAEGNTQFYIQKDGNLVGALSAEFTENAEHPMVLGSGFTPASEPGNEGVYEFQLEVTATNATDKKNVLTISDIPYGYRYEVWEQTTVGWEQISLSNDANKNDVADGTMLTTGKYTYTFTNDRTRHPLTIEKKVDGNQGSRDKYFKFTVNISNAGQRILHLDMTNATHALPSAASDEAKPNAATSYTWGTILNGSGSEGGNTRDDDGDTVYSEAAADGWANNCEWTDGTYTYRLNSDDLWEKYDANGDKVDEESVTVPAGATRTFAHGQHIKTDADGKATIVVYLQHGQSVQIRDLPYGASYTVTETTEDYRPTLGIKGDGFTDDKGTPSDIPTGQDKASAADSCFTEATTLTFTNTRKGNVPTGVRSVTAPAVILALLATGLGSMVLIPRRRRRKYE